MTSQSAKLLAWQAVFAAVACTPALGQGWTYAYDGVGNMQARAGVAAAPPVIIHQPQTRVVVPGELATFSVLLSDSRGAAYQWRFNGAPIAAATADTLVLSGVTAQNEGSYSVVVNNAFGSAASEPALLLIDANGNGLPDSWELAHFGNLNQPALGDFDGDGVSNLDEFLEGTDPADAKSFNPRLRVNTTPFGQVFPFPPTPFYQQGEVVTLLADPDPGASFLSWSESAIGYKPQISLLMNGHKFVNAAFGLLSAAPPVLLAIRADAANVILTWSAVANWKYQVQTTPDVGSPSWVNVGTVVTASGDIADESLSATGAARAFYRVVMLP